MNKHQRNVLKELAQHIDNSCVKQFGKKMTYIATEKRAIPAELRDNLGERRDGGFDMTGEKVAYEVNHFRRLKREFIKNGPEGVTRYAQKLGFTVVPDKIRQVLS